MHLLRQYWTLRTYAHMPFRTMRACVLARRPSACAYAPTDLRIRRAGPRVDEDVCWRASDDGTICSEDGPGICVDVGGFRSPPCARLHTHLSTRMDARHAHTYLPRLSLVRFNVAQEHWCGQPVSRQAQRGVNNACSAWDWRTGLLMAKGVPGTHYTPIPALRAPCSPACSLVCRRPGYWSNVERWVQGRPRQTAWPWCHMYGWWDQENSFQQLVGMGQELGYAYTHTCCMCTRYYTYCNYMVLPAHTPARSPHRDLPHMRVQNLAHPATPATATVHTHAHTHSRMQPHAQYCATPACTCAFPQAHAPDAPR
jgi:hypothetical protein